MSLRQWQADCIGQALGQYRSGRSHFLCLATPGAGKTRMAATLARRLLEQDLADLVVCLAPSVIVANDFRVELATETGERFDGLLGSRGHALTYQAMLGLSDDFWALFKRHRVFVIFDEIHHCAGHTLANANAWGAQIIDRIQGQAAYTLALTGTPWRSDCVPIVLARYCAEQAQIHCDYQYGLAQAIREGVCRTPRLSLIDNDRITLKSDHATQRYGSFRELLAESQCSYQQLLENEALILYMLRQANRRLNELRRSTPEAGGLIVAASVVHARAIAALLDREFGETAAIATYREIDPLETIRTFKENREKWIISVGMISEGTNVPRLRVCCHLTRVKTELYFRQVLGRILRANGTVGEEGYFYMPAEPTLVDYAHRLAEDIPSTNVVKFETMRRPRDRDREPSGTDTDDDGNTVDVEITLAPPAPVVSLPPPPLAPPSGPSALERTYETSLSVFGRFRQELLAINGIDWN